eukprot:NODE_23_length_42016_cov_0.755803.p16 type:complete len:328 gc:universal NODE_23_length_42016_cov_0.755803:39489-38506(-)
MFKIFQRYIRYTSPKSIIQNADSLSFAQISDLLKSTDLNDLEEVYLQMDDFLIYNFFKCYEASLISSESKLKNQFNEVLKRQFIPKLNFKILNSSSSSKILDQIVQHESNHPVISVHDLLENRFSGNKLIFAAFHPLMENTVLAYLKIGLSDKMAQNVSELLISKSLETSVANFYSIISPHHYLTGIGLGKLLISQAVIFLKKKFKTEKFYTLSPIPKFSVWLRQKNLIESCLQSPMMTKAQAKNYLLTEKRGKYCKCPVANFHLQNGAILFEIWPRANQSNSGMLNSLGAMVNYFYDLDKLEKNAYKYKADGTIPISPRLNLPKIY